MKHLRQRVLAPGLITALAMAGPVAFAEGGNCLNWKKLNLSQPQQQQIQTLEQDWNNKYMKVQPEILEQQRKLARLLMDPKSDPLEIMASQQAIARLKEQLRNEATSNYLRKRAILNLDQQHQLEGLMQQMVAERQRQAASVPPPDESSGFMDIIQKVRWAIQQH